eukprot:UN02322
MIEKVIKKKRLHIVLKQRQQRLAVLKLFHNNLWQTIINVNLFVICLKWQMVLLRVKKLKKLVLFYVKQLAYIKTLIQLHNLKVFHHNFWIKTKVVNSMLILIVVEVCPIEYHQYCTHIYKHIIFYKMIYNNLV